MSDTEIARHSGDPVQELINRQKFEEHRAVGTIDGVDVFLQAQIHMKAGPRLAAKIQPAASPPADDYSSEQEQVTARFSRTHDLLDEYRMWRDEYDLEQTAPADNP